MSVLPLAAVVLAGGFGTRLRSVLPDLPKPMAPVAGRSFLDWVLHYLARQGVPSVLLSTGYRAETIAAHFAANRPPGLDQIECIPEPEPLGTAGGFLHAIRQSGWNASTWLCLNGDSLALAPLHGLIRAAANGTPGLLAVHMPDAARYGSLAIAADGTVAAFREKAPGAAWINAGVYAVPDASLAGFPERRPLSWEIDLFPDWIASGTGILAERVEAPFLDIGIPESYAQAEEFIRAHADWFSEPPDSD